jgi:hypothetical protein
METAIKVLAPEYTGSTVDGVWYDSKYVTLVDGVTDGVDVGEYEATFELNPNYTWTNGDNNVTLTWYISKAAAKITTKPTAIDRTYNGESKPLVNAAVADYGTVYYNLEGSSLWQTSIPEAQNAGTYKVYYYTTGDDNHSASDQAAYVTVTIAKATLTNYKAPTKKTELKYNGSAQSLVNAGTAPSGFTMEYKLSTNSSYSTQIPTASLVGTYTVNYIIRGGTNYNDITGSVTDIKIAKASCPFGTKPIGVTSLTYTKAWYTLVSAGSSSYGTYEYKLGDSGGYSTSLPTERNAGEYKIYYRVVPNDTSKYEIAYGGPITVKVGRAKMDIDAGLTSGNLTGNGLEENMSYHQLINGNHVFLMAYTGTYIKMPVTDWAEGLLFKFNDSLTTYYGGGWDTLSVSWFVNHQGSGPSDEYYFINGADDSRVVARDKGTYTVRVKPDDNHCWQDGSTGERTFEWQIV